MHTIRQDGDNTWTVGFVEDDSMNGSCYGVMFRGMGFDSALRLCNVLNGGPGQNLSGLNIIKEWELSHG